MECIGSLTLTPRFRPKDFLNSVKTFLTEAKAITLGTEGDGLVPFEDYERDLGAKK